MTESDNVLATALNLLLGLDPNLLEIIQLSLHVTLTAVVFAAAVGIPFGALLAVTRFPGRAFIVLLVNTFMGLPPVVVGLVVAGVVGGGVAAGAAGSAATGGATAAGDGGW